MAIETDAMTGNNTWAVKQLRDDTPPGWRDFAIALQRLCQQLLPDARAGLPHTPLTQEMAAKRLLTNSSSLSRFLSARTVPMPDFTERLYKEACADAGGEGSIGIGLPDLRKLRLQAEAERRCASCSIRQVRTKPSQQAEEEDRALLLRERQEVKKLRAAVADLKESRAGLRARLAVRASSTLLPVPRRRGDRQQLANDKAAVRQLASRAQDVHAADSPTAALIMLRQTTEALSPLEMAGLLLLLRKQNQDDLADGLIHIYGRDQDVHEVMHAALSLHEQGAVDDAGELMRAAVT
ncbi:hypothetical protein [Streptomyces griseoluteus]